MIPDCGEQELVTPAAIGAFALAAAVVLIIIGDAFAVGFGVVEVATVMVLVPTTRPASSSLGLQLKQRSI